MALYFECRLNKNALLQTVFLVIFVNITVNVIFFSVPIIIIIQKKISLNGTNKHVHSSVQFFLIHKEARW